MRECWILGFFLALFWKGNQGGERRDDGAVDGCAMVWMAMCALFEFV